MGSYLAEQGVKKPGLIYITNNSAKADGGLVAAFKAGFKARGVTLSDNEIVVVDPTKPSYDDVVPPFKLDHVHGMAQTLYQTDHNRHHQAQDRQAHTPKPPAHPPSYRRGSARARGSGSACPCRPAGPRRRS